LTKAFKTDRSLGHKSGAVFPQLSDNSIPRRDDAFGVNRVRRLRGDEECRLVLRRSFAMMTMTARGAISVMTAVM
jgi:hypothetical protein